MLGVTDSFLGFTGNWLGNADCLLGPHALHLRPLGGLGRHFANEQPALAKAHGLEVNAYMERLAKAKMNW